VPRVDLSKRDGALRSLDAAGRAALDAAAAARCRARLVAAGVDPAAYTTAASAADLEDLRRVLRIPRWNLYGVSYSTRVMLPCCATTARPVRSAVLDSPLPASVRYDDASVGHFAGRSTPCSATATRSRPAAAPTPTCARASTRR
jgi:pimeloyl-ACP methyl ester carboxylesterase